MGSEVVQIAFYPARRKWEALAWMNLYDKGVTRLNETVGLCGIVYPG